MKSKLKQNQKGFTIIEVLIVLAIAGLIMVIVFLAVPALQRNSRNTQRTNDASLISSAIGECMANRNGQVSSCSSLEDLPLDTERLSQLTTVEAGTGFPGDAQSAAFGFALKCAADGATTESGPPRSYVVLFNTETAGDDAPRCVGS